MDKPRAYIHYEMGDNYRWGGLVVGRRILPVNVAWALIGLIVGLLSAWGFIGQIWVGWFWSFVPLMVFGGVVVILMVSILVTNLFSWMIRETTDANRNRA